MHRFRGRTAWGQKVVLADLSHRELQPEVMDQPGLDPRRHVHALHGLARLNAWSRSAAIVWSAICPPPQSDPSPLRILDIASGGGDVSIGIEKLARRAGARVDILGCDISRTAVEHATQRAAARSASVKFVQCDVLRDPLPDGFDCVISSLFLHHLEQPEAVVLMRKMKQATMGKVVISDLTRGRTGMILAQIATRLLTRSDVVHTDGPLSVKAAFTAAEAAATAKQAGLDGAVVIRCWPCRFLLTWTRPR